MLVSIVKKLFAEQCSADDIVALNNAIARDENMDDYIFGSIEELQELCQFEALDLARAVFFGNVESWNGNFYQFNGYGNIEQIRYIDEDYLKYFDFENIIENNYLALENIDNDDDILDVLNDYLEAEFTDVNDAMDSFNAQGFELSDAFSLVENY